MTRTLRAQWLSFRRIHLAALVADWRRTLLSVVGVALGVTVVLGVLILKSELVRPFDSFGPSLVAAAGDRVIAVTPNVEGRLPSAVVERLRTEVTGAEAVIPIVGSLTPVDAANGSHGFFLLGGSCQIELLVGPFDCERRARTDPPATGPGVPLQIPAVIAERQGLHPGDEIRIPGLGRGSAHIGWTFPEFERVEGINDGYVLLAPTAELAARLLGTPGYATTAFVVPGASPGVDASGVTADVDRVVAGVATAGPPRPQLPAVFENSKQSLDLVALAGIIVGILIAVNTILLAVEDRRTVMGTIGAIGAGPVALFGGMLGEGAVVGVLGGLLGSPGGFLLGSYLVDRFGQSMLAGSGATITAHFTPGLIVTAAAAGAVCGILAMSTGGPADPRRPAGLDGQRRRHAAGEANSSVALARRHRPAGGCRRGFDGVRARAVAGARRRRRHDRGIGRGGAHHGVDRTACRGPADLSGHDRPARARAAAGRRLPPLRTAVRAVGRPARRGHQPGHRVAEHAGARDRADRRAEGHSTAGRPADLPSVSPRSAGRPARRRHL